MVIWAPPLLSTLRWRPIASLNFWIEFHAEMLTSLLRDQNQRSSLTRHITSPLVSLLTMKSRQNKVVSPKTSLRTWAPGVPRRRRRGSALGSSANFKGAVRNRSKKASHFSETPKKLRMASIVACGRLGYRDSYWVRKHVIWPYNRLLIVISALRRSRRFCFACIWFRGFMTLCAYRDSA
ncbi:hypothetical protein BDW60DRAFT_172432 [Aspergillus nidulans var. acristatus]